jgi:hypothetical protein
MKAGHAAAEEGGKREEKGDAGGERAVKSGKGGGDDKS